MMRAMLNLSAAVVLIGGCAANPGADADVGYTDAAVVEVTNNNRLDMNIYVLRGEMRHRLGTVTSFQTQRFVIPTGELLATDGVRLLADPIGSQVTQTSVPLPLESGQVAAWRIESLQSMSTAWIRHR